MGAYIAKCDICGTENTVASYGDWACSQCGQGYTYDECHQIRLTDSQWALLRKPPRWIPVKERLPENGVDVLVASPCPNSNVPNIDIASWGSEGEQEPVWRESDCGRIWPTHWMPLPEPPEVE